MPESLRNVLGRLGPPEDIIAAELEGDMPARDSGRSSPAAPSPWGGLEIAAVALLAVGGIVLPLLGTMVGLALVWVSPRWGTQDKLVATGIGLLPLLLVTAILAANP